MATLAWCVGTGNTASALIEIETVIVADPGNPGEWAGASYGGEGDDRICGAVDYVYEIGKYEITTTQYAAFLNAVAATDAYGLWQPSMEATPSDPTDACGITRSGTEGSYSYAVLTGHENRPVNFVSFWSACRFVNWLENGQPVGVQDASTTEDGAYPLNGYTGPDGGGIVRRPGARYFIPSEDEWYKAAYFKGGGDVGYWDYPTQSDTPPTNEDPPGGVNSANYYHDRYATTCGCMTDVGAYDLAVGPYGTFDQAGNVGEYTDSIIGVFGGYTARGWEGGAFEGGGTGETGSQLPKTAANSRNYYPPHAYWVDHTGFRITKLPDCNENGVPDVCDLSCEDLGDFCDITGCGTSGDCNTNGVPDECDVSSPWASIYSTNFSADPGWVTNNPAHYVWQEADGVYVINQFNIDNGGEYAYQETDYRGGSFVLRWDLIMDWSDYASDVSFGMFDQDMQTKEGSYVRVMFTTADDGKYVILHARDSNDVAYQAASLPWHFVEGMEYHVELEYDAAGATLEARVYAGAVLQSTLLITDVGVFSNEMTRVGTSNLRNGPFQVPWADSAGRIDNVVLTVASADCNGNLIPDECELEGNDCNTNSVPDDCEADFDGDGNIDACDGDIDNDTVLNESDVCDFTPLGAAPILDPASCLYGTLRGDYDGDCDVDLLDFAMFAAESTGPF